MPTSHPTLTLVDAAVGAIAYAPAHAPAHAHAHAHLPSADRNPDATHPADALDVIHHARVEIYCGHNRQAVADIRTASKTLRAWPAPAPAQAVADLEQAARLVRRNQYRQAEEALDHAMGELLLARSST